jgi:hypothetical protein
MHVPPFGPSHPALHVQEVTLELELSELEFAGHARQVPSAVAPVELEYLPDAQLMHTASPIPTLYVPTPHCVHVLPVPANPAGHLHEPTR